MKVYEGKKEIKKAPSGLYLVYLVREKFKASECKFREKILDRMYDPGIEAYVGLGGVEKLIGPITESDILKLVKGARKEDQ